MTTLPESQTGSDYGSDYGSDHDGAPYTTPSDSKQKRPMETPHRQYKIRQHPCQTGTKHGAQLGAPHEGVNVLGPSQLHLRDPHASYVLTVTLSSFPFIFTLFHAGAVNEYW